MRPAVCRWACVRCPGRHDLTAVTSCLGITANNIRTRALALPFTSRAQLSAVKGVGTASFHQAAGFLRVTGSAEPLDNTSVHPDDYQLARDILSSVDESPSKVWLQ